MSMLNLRNATFSIRKWYMVRMMQIMSDECAIVKLLEVFIELVQVLRSPEVNSHVTSIYNLVLT